MQVFKNIGDALFLNAHAKAKINVCIHYTANDCTPAGRSKNSCWIYVDKEQQLLLIFEYMDNGSYDSHSFPLV